MGYLMDILIGAASRIVTGELAAHLEPAARWTINKAADRLPACRRERFREEWIAHLNETPGLFRKLLHAIGCRLAASALANIPALPAAEAQAEARRRAAQLIRHYLQTDREARELFAELALFVISERLPSGWDMDALAANPNMKVKWDAPATRVTVHNSSTNRGKASMGHVEQLARWIIETAANRLPASERERFREEWLAHLEETSGTLGKIWHSIGCYLGAAKLAEARLRTETGSVLIAAIEGRRLMSIWYDPGVRVVEPYALGCGSDGKLLLRAYQVAGATASDHQPFHWKLFRLDRIRDAKLCGTAVWKPRPEYQRDDRAMTKGIVHAAPSTEKTPRKS